MTKLFVNGGVPDQRPHSVASDLGLHCLPVTLLGICSLIWVKGWTKIQTKTRSDSLITNNWIPTMENEILSYPYYWVMGLYNTFVISLWYKPAFIVMWSNLGYRVQAVQGGSTAWVIMNMTISLTFSSQLIPMFFFLNFTSIPIKNGKLALN